MGAREALGPPAHAGRRLRVGELSTPVLLTALVAVSAVVRFAVALAVRGPVHVPDEVVYSELAKSFAGSGHFAVRGAGWSAWTYGPVYDVLAAPAYLLSSLVGAFAAVKLINALLFSLAAIPAYLLARRVTSRRGALVAAVLALLVPSGVYTANVLTENAAYPAFLLAVLVIAAALERPGAARELAAIGAVCLAALARVQLVALLPALACAIVLLAWREPGPFTRRLRSHRTTWIALAVLAAFGLALAISGSLLGPHSIYLGRAHASRLPSQLLWHLADLDLYSGVIPFIAFLLVCGAALGPAVRDTGASVLAAVAASVFVCLVLFASVFGTAFKVHGVSHTHVFDRYVFYVVPLFLIALVAWVERGLPRPRTPLTVIAVTAAVLPATLPFRGLFREFTMSSVGLVPWLWTGAFVGRGWALNLVACAFAGALALAVVRVSSARAWSLVRISAALLVAIGFTATVSTVALANRGHDGLGSLAPDWVDARVGPSAQVALVWKGKDRADNPYRSGLRTTEFFNRSIGAVYDLEDPLVPSLPETHVSVRDGRLVRDDGRPVRTRYVVAPESLRVRGVRLDADPRSGLALYRTGGPVRLRRS